MPTHWLEELRLLLGTVLIAALAGALTAQWLPCLLLGLLLYLGWHLNQLARLLQLYRQDGQRRPWPYGLWKGILREIQAQQDSNDNRTRELTHQLERFRDAVGTLPDAVVIMDTSGLIDWSNPAAAGLLGITWPQAQGRLLTALAPDPLLDDYLAGADFTTPVVITSPSNRAKILSVYIAPLKHEANRLLLVARDITRQYYLDMARRDFVANVSHELRTPLTVISGLAEQLNTDQPDLATLPRSTALMHQQARRMNELVSELLTLSRLEMQPQSVAGEPVPVGELLTMIVEEARALSGTGAARLLQLDIHSPAGLHGNAKELRHRLFKPGDQCHQTHPEPGRSQNPLAGRTMRGAHLSVTDTGSRHSRPPYTASDRTPVPGRCQPFTRHRRHGPRTGHRQTRPRASRCETGDYQQGGRWQYLYTAHFPPESVVT